MSDRAEFSLGKDEALILFELLADFHDAPAVVIGDNAQRLALVRLAGALESTLVELFMPNYNQIINDARERLECEWGGRG